MENSRKDQPIFVVGAPRSGTTLLSAMLAAHSRLSCGPETNFFRFLARADVNSLCEPNSWPDNAIEFLFSGNSFGRPIPEHYDITKEEIRSYLREQSPSVAAILSAITELYMKKVGKYRWVEKTPSHLTYVHDIRTYFPESPIIRIMRDPRDVALSIIKTPWERAPKNFGEAVLFWQKYDRQSAAFFRSDKRSYTLYYERLIDSPESELKQLCSLIAEDYEPAMLDTSAVASRVFLNDEKSWHQNVGKPVNKTRAYVWKREVTQEQNRVAEALIGDRLLAYGYENLEQFNRPAYVYPSLPVLLKYPLALRSLVKSLVDLGVRFWRVSDHEKYQLLLFIGDPDADGWLGTRKLERLTTTLRIVLQAIQGKWSNKPIYWIRKRDTGRKLGRYARVLSFVIERTEVVSETALHAERKCDLPNL
jgi:hypothetical protein